MRKWFLRACACMLLAGALAGCGAPGIADNRIKIGMNMATRDEFLTSMEAAAVKAAGADNVRLDVANANNDQQAQLAQIKEWAEEGYAAAIVVLCEDEAADKVLEKAGTMRWCSSTAALPTMCCKAGPTWSISAAARPTPGACRGNTWPDTLPGCKCSPRALR